MKSTLATTLALLPLVAFNATAQAAADPRTRLQPFDEPVRDMVVDYVRRHRSISIPEGTNAVVVLKEPRAWHRRK